MPRWTPRGMRNTKPTIDFTFGHSRPGFISGGAFFMRSMGATPHMSAPAFFAISLMRFALIISICPVPIV